MKKGIQHDGKLYDRIRVLGKGSFGTASVHRRRADCALVVLKEIDLHRFRRECMERSFVIQEARIMSTLNHTNIIKYYNAYLTETKLIIEMEYASMGTLQNYLSIQTQPLDEAEILVIFKQITSGLNYLHSKNIIHLDLKTANIFVTIGGLVKIGDFGIAKFMDESKSSSNMNLATGHNVKRINTSSHLLGTLAYSSPERCIGETTDFKSDIWSLGCILYELITSRPLYSAESLPELVLNITRIKYQPINRNITMLLRETFERMISRVPRDRPSARELVHIADQLLSLIQNKRIGVVNNKQRHHNRLDLSTEATFLAVNKRTDMSQINYPHSLVYQVRLDSQHIHVDRVYFPQTKRIKEISKGRSHYLVLTYDSIVYGWGSKKCGQLGACSLNSSMTAEDGNNVATSMRFRKSHVHNSNYGHQHQATQSFQHSLTASSLASSSQSIVTTTAPANAISMSSSYGGKAANQKLSKQIIMSMLEKSKPASKPFIMNELNHRKIIQVAAGNDFSVFLTKTGIVMTCGDGSTGCLGRGDLKSCFTPCMVDCLLSRDVVSIACGPKHVVCVCGNGSVFSWGENTNGRLGLATDQSANSQNFIGIYVVRPQPIQFPPDTFIKSAFCGDRCTIFIDSNDRCWACGENRFNKLGLDIKRRFKKTIIIEKCLVPTQISSLNKYKIVSCKIGKNHSSFITSEGKLIICGQDLDHTYRLGSNIVDRRDSHRRISFELQTANNSRYSRKSNQLYQTKQKVPTDYKSLTRSMILYDKLSSFKQSVDNITRSDLWSKYPKEKASRAQRQQIESYLRISRASKKMSFEYVVSVSCTSKFTLALTNDNRVYFWGTRSYERADSPYVSQQQQRRKNHEPTNGESVEPQLINSNSDECFIKIASTNSSLMSSIQVLGSDQPIILAQDPLLKANLLSDLWILDYRPTSPSSSSSVSSISHCSSCCADCTSNSEMDCDCQQNCSICASNGDNRSRVIDVNNSDHDLIDDEFYQRYCSKHDAILEPQPIVSLFIPSMFNHNGGGLNLVNLFCFDEDRFYLILDTTAKLQTSGRSRGFSSMPSVSQPLNTRDEQYQTTSPTNKHKPLSNFDINESNDDLAPNHDVSSDPSINRSSTIDLIGRSKPTEENDDKNFNATKIVDVCVKEIQDQCKNDQNCVQPHQSPIKIEVEVNNNCSSGGAENTCDNNYAVSMNNSSQGAMSMDEPRSMSTFIGTFGGEIIVGPSLRSNSIDQTQMRPIRFNHQSQTSNNDESPRLQAQSPSSDPSNDSEPTNVPVPKFNRRGRMNHSESNTFVGNDIDDTSSMPSWVKNEYIQHQAEDDQESGEMFLLEREGSHLSVWQSSGSGD